MAYWANAPDSGLARFLHIFTQCLMVYELKIDTVLESRSIQ